MAGLDNCGKLDITEMSPNDIVVIGNKVWVKAEVEEKIWIYEDRPCTVIKFSDSCYAKICNDAAGISPAILNAAQNLNIFGDCSKNPQPQSTSQNMDNGNEQKAITVRPDVVAGDNKKNLQTAQGSVDAPAANHLGTQPSAVMPSVAVIPMKSNTVTYGPYASSNFGSSCGGIQVEINNDLAPWVFGSVGLMHTAGQAIVSSMGIGLNKAETGAVTIPGLPIASLSKLGVALGGGGPTLSSMNFSYGSGGISTSYEFRTYTPKFGGLSRHIVDRIKDVSKNRQDQIKFLRAQASDNSKINRQGERFNRRINRGKHDAGPAPDGQQSLGRVLVAEIYDWQDKGQRTVIGLDTLHKSIAEMERGYDKKAYMSWDLLFGPLSKAGDGGLPQYAKFISPFLKDHKSSPQQPQPPFAIEDKSSSEENTNVFENGLDQYNLEITRNFTDPLTNNFEEDEHHHDGAGRGHVVDLVGGGTEIPEKGLITNFYPPDDEDRYDEDYRFVGMRGPIVLHSWGYDTEGKPIPNASDTEDSTKTGQFTGENLKDEFLKDWLGKPATWPAAPIDFRFDRKRGVWVSPPGYKVVLAILDEKLEKYSSAKASLINDDLTNKLKMGPDLYNQDGEKVKATTDDNSEAKIQVEDRLGKTYSSGTRLYCYYDTFSTRYIILEAAQKYSIRFRLIDLCSETPVEPDYGDIWTKYAGYRDKFPNNHILGIRIDCEGNPIDNKGNFISHDDIVDEEKQKDIFINLFDTCGTFGAAYAYYDPNGGQQGFNEWKQKAATGFALLCDPTAENTCSLGESTTQCSSVNPEYDSYDIIFLDSYARFVECELSQKLYLSEEEAEEQFPNDEYKKEHPAGNAAANILQYYGDAGNGREPKFYDNQEEIEFRVFDPYINHPKARNPFAKLDYRDKVIAVFDENKKKYIIYSALKDDDKVVKFALVDNKDLGDPTARAVLVDTQGYPIDEIDNRLTEENFADNFITVTDTFAVHGNSDPEPKYHNWGKTGFGPALGSDNFQEHMNGIVLAGGDQDPPDLPDGSSSDDWTGGPFIGYALRRTGKDYGSNTKTVYYEIISLEGFAKIVLGKIASIRPIIESQYYLATRRIEGGKADVGFTDGRIPITRYPINENSKANLRVGFPLDQHLAGKYIAGDFFEGKKEEDGYYEEGKAYECTDGCKFVAQLDHTKSRVNNGEEKLYYTIIEVENIANRVKTSILKQQLADSLNASEVKQKSDDSEGIVSQFMDGWIWDKTVSKSKYEEITFYNRDDWKNNGLLIKNGLQHIHSELSDYDSMKGAVKYQIDHAGTISQIAESTVPSNIAAKFGLPNAVGSDEKKISKFGSAKFYHGLNPLGLEEQDQPIFDVSSPWMTYDGANIVSLWDETGSSEIKSNKYRVVYAREAPVIITGLASEEFRPEQADGITIDIGQDLYPSCPGVTQKPMQTLLTKIKNPMGYGAQKDDLVTVQRVNITQLQDEANYYYMVIGTSAPPKQVTG